mgnify:CR=1 FL=1
MLAAFRLLSIEPYLPSSTLRVLRLSFAKFGRTELRILLSLGNIVLFFHPDARVPGLPYRMLDFAGAIAIAAMSVMAVVAAIAHTRQLYLEETI